MVTKIDSIRPRPEFCALKFGKKFFDRFYLNEWQETNEQRIEEKQKIPSCLI